MEQLHKERFAHIRENLAKLYSGVEMNEIYNTYTLSNDPTMKELALQRFTEVTGNELAAEREMYIERLCHELTTVNEKALMSKVTTNNEEVEAKKKKYKAMVKAL